MSSEPPSARFEFPSMLYGMLEQVTFDDELCHIVSWQPHGLAFKVHDREAFERILPRWFKEKYESFRCLLEQWGFIKLSRGRDRGCWYQVNFGHGQKAKLQGISKEDFLEGMPEYLSPREEPDLYSMATEESSITLKKKRLKTLRDNGVSQEKKGGGSLKSSNRKDSSNKRSRGDDDDAGPPSKKEKKSKKDGGSSNDGGGVDSKNKGQSSASSSSSQRVSLPPPPSFADGGGCKICKHDDDHPNLLLCEACDTEIHTYCLNPPLDSVPDDDWFCDECESRMKRDRKTLEKMVKKMPQEMRSRFGEVCWSKSGERAHWWPAMIFDPRAFLHNKDVVELSKRNMGKRNLVFYFENQDAFAAVPESWILTWKEGVERDYDKGKTFQSASEIRREQFHKALDAAKMTMLADAPSGRAKKDVERSDQESSTSEEESVSLHEAEPSPKDTTPSNPLKEVANEAVLCSSCGKPVDLSKGPVLLDGYWFCHSCHKGPSSSKVSSLPSRAVRPPSGTINADETWLSVRDDAINQVGGSNSLPQVEIDDEILKGITMRPSGKWQAQVYYAGKSRYIGVFETRQKAALAFQLVRNKLRPAKNHNRASGYSVKPPSPPSDGAVRSSFSNLFSKKKYSGKTGEKVDHSFTDKKPGRDRSKQLTNMSPLERSSNQRSPHRIDTERTRIILDTPLCRFYASMPLCDL